MINEAWTNALQANEEEKDAEAAVENGKTIEDFIKEEEEKDDPNDTRSLAEKLAAAAKAWAEAMNTIKEGLNEDIAAAKRAEEDALKL